MIAAFIFDDVHTLVRLSLFLEANLHSPLISYVPRFLSCPKRLLQITLFVCPSVHLSVRPYVGMHVRTYARYKNQLAERQTVFGDLVKFELQTFMNPYFLSSFFCSLLRNTINKHM